MFLGTFYPGKLMKFKLASILSTGIIIFGNNYLLEKVLYFPVLFTLFLTTEKSDWLSCCLTQQTALMGISQSYAAISCFRLKRSKIRVILGDHDQTITTESAAIMRAVTAIVRHRSFDADSYNNDIALLKLRKPVNFSKIIKPVCLPPASKLQDVCIK